MIYCISECKAWQNPSVASYHCTPVVTRLLFCPFSFSSFPAPCACLVYWRWFCFQALHKSEDILGWRTSSAARGASGRVHSHLKRKQADIYDRSCEVSAPFATVFVFCSRSGDLMDYQPLTTHFLRPSLRCWNLEHSKHHRKQATHYHEHNCTRIVSWGISLEELYKVWFRSLLQPVPSEGSCKFAVRTA